MHVREKGNTRTIGVAENIVQTAGLPNERRNWK